MNINKISESSDLHIASYNLHGFKSNWNYLKTLLDSHDIVFVQELWLLDCEFELLHGLSNDFTVHARSGMSESAQSGILKGRPFGGVAVFIRKNLSRFVSFCSCDDAGRVVCVKLTSVDQNLLLCGCYFPCNDHVGDYANRVADVFGFIESVCQQYPGFKVCLLGDLNFEYDMSNVGYRLCVEFANRYKLDPCDNLSVSQIDYTYRHISLGHKSCLDHVFISEAYKNLSVIM